MTEKKIEDMTFEEAMDALDTVVRALEGGEVPLEKSIALYERGDALKKHCEAKLGEAELKVEKITAGADGTATDTEPFKTE
ncbi:MAG: exodeoxyribonuclease VII small subunit [Paracoccaceae bacterium]|nr:exodeoxyribonuclease VII small subunit [Paracoccaceae bacterium]